MPRIYLDFAAATPIDPEVWQVFESVSKQNWANPSAIHLDGQKTRGILEEARLKAVKFLNAKTSKEIIFTSTATEANNLALKGLVRAYNKTHNNQNLPHILISKIEHACVLESAKYLQKRGECALDFIPVNSEGFIDVENLENLIKPETVFISTIWVNNEIGTIQPIETLSNKIQKINEKRKSEVLPQIFWHVDAVQVPLFLEIDVQKLGVDLLTLSAHKIYSPKGAALLYIKQKTLINSEIQGGGQEFGLRSGTQNLPAIVSFSKALEICEKNREQDFKYILTLQNYLLNKLPKNFKINGPLGNARIVNNINFSIFGIDNQVLHTALDLAGISISSGSSCSSGSHEISHVIKAIYSKEEILQNFAILRITLGRTTTKDEIDKFLEALTTVFESGKLAL